MRSRVTDGGAQGCVWVVPQALRWTRRSRMSEPVPSSQLRGADPTRGEYEQLYLAEYERIARTVFLVVRDAGRAEDITQEAFVRLYLRWGTVGTYERPGAWVRKVAIRLATREARRERLRSILERQAPPPVVTPDLDADLVREV